MFFISVIQTCSSTKDKRASPSCCKPLFESEAKYKAIDIKVIFSSRANKTHFYNKGFTLGVVLKVRVFGTRKWPVILCSCPLQKAVATTHALRKVDSNL